MTRAVDQGNCGIRPQIGAKITRCRGQIATSHSSDARPKFKESSSIKKILYLCGPTPLGIIFTNIRFPKGVIVTLMVIHAPFHFP